MAIIDTLASQKAIYCLINGAYLVKEGGLDLKIKVVQAIDPHRLAEFLKGGTNGSVVLCGLGAISHNFL